MNRTGKMEAIKSCVLAAILAGTAAALSPGEALGADPDDAAADGDGIDGELEDAGLVATGSGPVVACGVVPGPAGGAEGGALMLLALLAAVAARRARCSAGP
jgi:MYXO-CTERM domain-containing protein